MSDEPVPKDQPTEWVMTEPIFRTSEGRTPKRANSEIDADEIDTESPQSDETDPDDIPTEIPNRGESKIAEDESVLPDEKPANTVRAKPAKNAKPKRGCAKSFLIMISLIVVAAVAVIFALIYFLFYYGPAETGTF